MGVCSIYDAGVPVVICPIRFQEGWRIASDAARFFFPPGTRWERLPEVRLRDGTGQPAGDIDLILAAHDESGLLTAFGSVEVQAVYISGNIRDPFTAYMSRKTKAGFVWTGKNFPRPDYLSSSRKRLVPQLLYKGAILKAWGVKQAVVLNRGFYDTLPSLPTVPEARADMVWLIYDLVPDQGDGRFHLQPVKTVYTEFEAALDGIGNPPIPTPTEFRGVLQGKLDTVRRVREANVQRPSPGPT